MKQTPGSTTADRERYWTKIIKEAREYSAGVLAYCRDKGIPKDNYYSWFKRLRSSHPEWANLNNAKSQAKKSRQGKPNSKTEPETEVFEKARRRKFSAKDKARILREVDAASAGQVAAILRREGLYTSHLQKWRLERDERALAPKKRGPKVNPLASAYKKLQAENTRLQKKLAHTNALLELQKKVAEILGTTIHESDENS
jgi:transposase